MVNINLIGNYVYVLIKDWNIILNIQDFKKAFNTFKRVRIRGPGGQCAQFSKKLDFIIFITLLGPPIFIMLRTPCIPE